MTEYTIVVPTPIDLQNASSCIPHEQFIQILPELVLKTDAIKLGLCCFVAGMITIRVIDYIYERYFNGNP